MKYKLLRLAVLLLCLAPAAAAQTATVIGTFKTAENKTPAQAGLERYATIAATSVYGYVDFEPIDLAGRVVREMTCDGLTYLPLKARAWIKADGTLMRADGTAGITLIPNEGCLPAGLAYRATIFLNKSSDGRIAKVELQQSKNLPDVASVDWAALSPATISTPSYPFQLQTGAAVLTPESWTHATAASVTTPASGISKPFFDSADGHFKYRTSAGTLVDLSSGGVAPTGTGFRHVTAGTEDAATKLVEDADVHASAAIAQSKIANLTTDLALKAPLASPAFTGTLTHSGVSGFGPDAEAGDISLLWVGETGSYGVIGSFEKNLTTELNSANFFATLHVGQKFSPTASGVPNFSSAAFSARGFTASGSTRPMTNVVSQAVFADLTHQGSQLWGYPQAVTGTVSVTGGGSVTKAEGLYGTVTAIDGSISDARAVFATGGTGGASGSITNLYGFYGKLYKSGGLGTVTNAYGLFLEDVTAGGTLNYAIYSGAGLNRLGDSTTIGRGAATSYTLTGDVSGTDTVITFGNGVVNVSAGTLQQAGTAVSLAGHTQAWSTITSTPTTLAGYGITDAQALDADLTAIAAISTTLGDLIYGNATPAWTRLAGNTTATKKFLVQTGTGAVSAAPAWDTIVDGDVPDTITASNYQPLLSGIDALSFGVGAAATVTLTGNVTGTDSVITFGSSSVDITTGTLKQAGTAVSLTGHGHAISDTTGLQTALDAKAPLANPTFTGTAVTVGGGVAVTEFRLLEPSGGGASYAGFKAPALGGNLVWSLPTADSTGTQCLKSDGSLNLSFAACGGAITGTNTHVLFFDGTDNPAGDAGLTYNKTTDVLTAVGGFSGALTGNVTGNASGTAATITGALALANTPLTTLGDLLYVNVTPALTRLAGNTTTTKKFLTQTGTGAVSAVPVWDTIIAGDIPSLAATYQIISEKNAASGYAGLTAGTKLNLAQMQEVMAPADLTGVADTSGSGTTLPLGTFSSLAANDVMSWNGSNWVNAVLGVSVNAQTGVSYTIAAGDKSKLVTHSNAGAIAVTLPQAGASFPDGWYYFTENRGAGTVTITPTTSTIDGAASLTLEQNDGVFIASDGANYYTSRGRLRTHTHATTAQGGTLDAAAIATGTFSAALLPLPTASTIGAIKSLTCGGTDKLSAIGTDGVPVCSADVSGGTPSWSDLTAPGAAVSMVSNQTTETVTFDFQAAFTTGSQFVVKSSTGTPSGGVLFEILGHDGDVQLMKITNGGTNGVAISAAGALTATGSGSIAATSVPWSGVSSTPTTLSGYGITDAQAALATIEAVSLGAGAGATVTFTGNVSGTDSVITFGSSSVDITTGTLKQGGTSVALQSVTLTAGAGLSGGGDISTNRSFATASGEADFLASGALTCGASTQGKIQVHTTPLQYCDNAGTPALQYAAYGDSTGNASVALTGDSATAFFSTGTLEAAILPLPTASTIGAIKSLTCGSTDKLSAIGTDGVPVCSADVDTATAWNALAAPSAATSFVSNQTTETVTFDFQAAFTTGSQFIIKSSTGTPSGGYLLEIAGHDADVKPFKLTGDGTNGVEMSAAGSLAIIGTGGIVATTGDSATSFFAAGTLEDARLTTFMQTRMFGFVLGADNGVVLVDADDQASIFINWHAVSVTLEEIYCECDGGSPTVNFQRDDGAPANILSTALTVASTGACARATAVSSTINSAVTCVATLDGTEKVLSAGHRVDWLTGTAGGVAKRITCWGKYAQ